MGPLSRILPKPLCPVGNVALLDQALHRVAGALGPGDRPSDLAVNVCHGRDLLIEHLAGRVHVSVETTALGTAGALGALRDWLDGRGALVVNGDTWCPAALADFVAGWDGERVSVLVTGAPPLHARSGIVASLLPWREVAALPAEPLGLWEGVWRDRLAEGALGSVGYDGPFVDCATPADYLRANHAALAHRGLEQLVAPGATLVEGAVVGAASVVGAGASVAGRIAGSVVWPGAAVAADEVLDRAVRAPGGVTVLVR